MGKASWALWGGLGDLVCNISLSILLVHLFTSRWGAEWAILGPAVATVFATYAQVSILVLLIARHLNWSLPQLMPWPQLLRITAFSLSAAVVSLALSQTADQPALKLLVGLVSFAGVLSVASWMHSGQREEIRSLLAALRAPSRA